MRTLSFVEAATFLAEYPAVRAALDADGLKHAERMALGVKGPTLERLKRGEITASEDQPPIGAMPLSGREAAIRAGHDDNSILVAVAFVYAKGLQ